jgi:hypothetical protein
MSKFVKLCLRELMVEYKDKPYDYWETVEMPITFERVFEGKVVQVEIHVLESTPEYLQIGISVDAGRRSLFYPFGQSFIVEKK